ECRSSLFHNDPPNDVNLWAPRRGGHAAAKVRSGEVQDHAYARACGMWLNPGALTNEPSAPPQFNEWEVEIGYAALGHRRIRRAQRVRRHGEDLSDPPR